MILAEQRPAWEPGTRHGYHGISLGWYEGELLRRVDPAHRTLGRFFAEVALRDALYRTVLGEMPQRPD